METVPEIGGGDWKGPPADSSEVVRWHYQLVRGGRSYILTVLILMYVVTFLYLFSDCSFFQCPSPTSFSAAGSLNDKIV